MSGYDRLSGLDASFLALERIETPMHIGSLAILEGAPFFDERGRFRLAEVRRLVASRLHFIPRFRKRVMEVPFGLGRPVWIDDERFDIGYHVRLTALPAPGSRTELLALFERVEAQMLDRARPLWELWFVEGLEGGQVAVFQKTHHALVDGVSGVDVATVLFDFTREPTIPDGPEWVPEPGPSAQQLLVDTVVEELGSVVHVGRVVADALQVPQRAAAQLGQLGRSMATLAEGRLLAPRLSINQPVGRHRRFLGVKVPLDDVKVVRGVYGGTVNDVVLAGVAGGLARLLDVARRAAAEPQGEGDVPGVGAGRRRAPGARATACRRWSCRSRWVSPIRSRASRRSARRPRTSRSVTRRSPPTTLIDLTQYAAPTLLGLAGPRRAPPGLLQPDQHERPRSAGAVVLHGRGDAGGVPDGAAGAEPGLGIAILSYCGSLHLGLLGRPRRVPRSRRAGRWHRRTPSPRCARGPRPRARPAPAEAADAVERRRAVRRLLDEFWTREAWALADAVRAGELRAVDLLDGYLARIDGDRPDAQRRVLPRRRPARRRPRRRSTTQWREGMDPGPARRSPRSG